MTQLLYALVFSVLLTAEITTARENPERIRKKWVDVFVVGSGPVGATFARKLVMGGRSVFMVDAGAFLSERAGEHLKNGFFFQRNLDQFTPVVAGHLLTASVATSEATVPTLDPAAFRLNTSDHRRFLLNNQNPEQNPHENLDGAAVTYAVGGMATHWTCATPRHHPTMERSELFSDEEWNKLYKEAEELLLTHNNTFSHSIRHTIVKEALQAEFSELRGASRPQHIPLAGYRRKDNPDLMHWAGTDDVFGPLLDDAYFRSRFTLKSQHLVEKLVLTSDGKAVHYALVRDLKQWKLFRVYANQFVVTGGAILTPQILFNSGIRPKALGRYLVEQPLAFTQVVMKESLIKKSQHDLRFLSRMNSHETRYPQDPLPFPFNDPDPQLYIPVSEGRPWHAQIHRDSFAFGAVRSNVDSRAVVDFRWFGTMEPREDNYLTFSETIKDSMGMPQPTFRYVLTEEEKEQNHKMMQDMLRAATAVGGFMPESLPQFMKPGTSLHITGTSLHITGTTRMGRNNDGTSVVDEHSRVWGIGNLFLGGNGVIPTGTASNPTLTSVAIAIRSANQILAESLVNLLPKDQPSKRRHRRRKPSKTTPKTLS